MKKIGFLFGDEISFSKSLISFINSTNNINVYAEEIKIGIFNTEDTLDFDVIFDRFSHKVPFYITILNVINDKGIKIIHASDNTLFEDKFACFSKLKKARINIPKTSIIPNKIPPFGIENKMLRNLEYPLDWNKMFQYIGFPACVITNRQNSSFYNFIKVYNNQEFYSVYDSSEDNVLLLQQTFDYVHSFRTLVVDEDFFIVGFDGFQPIKNRYFLIDDSFINAVLKKKISTIIKTIKRKYNIDIFYIDFGLTDKIYVLDINTIQNIDNCILPDTCYQWLIKTTSEFLMRQVGISAKKLAKK